MQTTTTPLWQKLNEERTQGEWVADNFDLITIPFPIHVMQAKESKIDAQYTALAVNNLASLAEALQGLIELCEVFHASNDKITAAKTALKRIS